MIKIKMIYVTIVFSTYLAVVVSVTAHADTNSPAQAASAGTPPAVLETLPGWFTKALGMQFNGIYQNLPSFNSPYTGPNSFSPGGGKGHAFSHIYSLYLRSQILPNLQAFLDIEMF